MSTGHLRFTRETIAFASILDNIIAVDRPSNSILYAGRTGIWNVDFAANYRRQQNTRCICVAVRFVVCQSDDCNISAGFRIYIQVTGLPKGRLLLFVEFTMAFLYRLESYKSARLTLHITLLRNYLLEVVVVSVLLVFWLTNRCVDVSKIQKQKQKNSSVNPNFIISVLGDINWSGSV